MNDSLTQLESVVRFTPSASIRFISEELRRYGIKSNKKNEMDKTVFFQSAHIIQIFDRVEVDSDTKKEVRYPSYALVSFKDLFKLIGKNDEGVDAQDIVRVWVIAHKLEKRKMINIVGTATQTLDADANPDLPDVYANLHHIHRSDADIEKYSYKSKFASNKAYKTTDGKTLLGVSDFFVIV